MGAGRKTCSYLGCHEEIPRFAQLRGWRRDERRDWYFPTHWKRVDKRRKMQCRKCGNIQTEEDWVKALKAQISPFLGFASYKRDEIDCLKCGSRGLVDL